MNPVGTGAASDASERAPRAPRVAAGRGPARRLAAVGPGPARARHARRGRRAAADRGQRRAPGARDGGQDAARPQHRAQRGHERPGPAARAREALAAARPGAGCCPASGTSRSRPHALEARSHGAFRLITSQADLAAYLAAREARGGMTAGLLAIEGAHALDDDPRNLDAVADLGVRMISPAHFFDTAFGGSAHGAEQGGLTVRGRELLEAMEARGVLFDVAHASAPDDRRRARAGHPARRRVAHRRARRARQRAQPVRRAAGGDRRDRRPRRDRVLGHGLRRHGRGVDRALDRLCRRP